MSAKEQFPRKFVRGTKGRATASPHKLLQEVQQSDSEHDSVQAIRETHSLQADQAGLHHEQEVRDSTVQRTPSISATIRGASKSPE